MEEPRRLLEESENGLERALLRAGTSYRTPSKTRLRTLISLGLAGSATLAGVANGAPLSTVAKSGWVKVLAASAIGAAAAIPVVSAVTTVFHTPAEPAAVVAAAPARSAAPPTHQPTRAEQAPAAAPTAGPVAPKAPPPTARSGVSRSTAPRPVATPALTEELAALDRARGALASGDAGRALGLLDGYARTYPRGRLQLEAEVLRIDALARAGQREAARRRADAFLRRQPNSVLASRVRSYL